MDRLSPDPDEAQRLLPWPSWAWQRCCLIACLPLAGIVLLAGLAQGAWLAAGAGVLLLAASLASGVLTRWLRDTRQAPTWVRATGGTCVAVSGAAWTLALVYAVLVVALLVVLLLITGVFLRAMLENTLDR